MAKMFEYSYGTSVIFSINTNNCGLVCDNILELLDSSNVYKEAEARIPDHLQEHISINVTVNRVEEDSPECEVMIMIGESTLVVLCDYYGSCTHTLPHVGDREFMDACLGLTDALADTMLDLITTHFDSVNGEPIIVINKEPHLSWCYHEE